MAVRIYPVTIGYGSWTIRRGYSSDEPIFGSREFGSTRLALPAHPQGVLLWMGRFTTPVYRGGSVAAVDMQTLMESLAEGIHQLTLPIPTEHRITGVLGATLTAQPLEIQPPVRSSRGLLSGWAVEWIEVP